MYLSSRCSTMERNFDNPYIVFVYYERGGGKSTYRRRKGILLSLGDPWKRDKESLKLRFVELEIITGHHLACTNDLCVGKLCRRFRFFFWNKDRIPLFFLSNWSPWIVIALQLDVDKYRTHENRLNVCWQLRRFAKFAIQQRFFVLSRVLGLLTLLFRVASLVTKWYSIKCGIFMNEFTRYSNFFVQFLSFFKATRIEYLGTTIILIIYFLSFNSFRILYIHNNLEESRRTSSKIVSLVRYSWKRVGSKKDQRNIGEQSGSNSIGHPWIAINRLHENPVQTLVSLLEEKVSGFRLK